MRAIDFIALGVIWLWGSMELSIGRKKLSKAEERRGDDHRLAYIVTFASIALGIGIGLAIKLRCLPLPYSRSLAFPVSAIALVVAGEALRLCAIGTLKHRFTVNLAIIEGHSLVTSGPYRFLRHPAYAGSLLAVLGCGLAFGNPVSFLVIFLPYSILLTRRIDREEKMLLEGFGDAYREYRKRTKKLIPFIY
jgi:protein-S-isoprenylcysteine O-methyltransferase Ste14